MRSVGRYVLVEEIGRGSMGTVFRATDPLIERTVAVKTVHLARLDDGSLEPRMRFLREAKAAGRLTHPGIVAVYDVGELEDLAFIVMEFVEGRSLKEVLEAGTRVPLGTAAEIVRQAADALAVAHRSGVVHRDVKPGNLMLTRDGTVKVTDFGIARIDQSQRTRTGVLVGSPGYMSPEQLSGKPVDGRSDLFSLGSVFYELATGKGPFEPERAEDVLQLMTNIVSRPHAAPSAVAPGVPGAVDAIVARALAKDPARRYATAEAMSADLRAALAAALRPASGDPGIAELARRGDVLLPEFDLYAETGVAAAPVGPAAPTVPIERAPDAPPAAGGLLERLRGEAERIEISGGTDDTATATLMRRFDVERRMRAGLGFYQELVRYLGVVKPEIGHRYGLDGLGGFARARVADAFVDSRVRREGGRPWTESVLLTLVAVSPETLRLACAPGESATVLERLAGANLRYESEAPPESGAPPTLIVAGEITIHARIMADRARGRIAFLCRNVAGFGAASFVVDARAVEDSIFEAFANHVLGQPGDFLALAGKT
ncbi:MAG: serine/threonine-protein kinase [Burkholderiales bacterium]